MIQTYVFKLRSPPLPPIFAVNYLVDNYFRNVDAPNLILEVRTSSLYIKMFVLRTIVLK